MHSDPTAVSSHNTRRILETSVGALGLALLLAAAARPAIAATADAEQNTGLQEIIVTAEKKSERLQDVPIPITQVAAATLVENNEVRLQDFYTEFPGLNVTLAQQSSIQFTVRGLPGAITIDDVPISITSFLEEAGGLGLDLDPSGLAQVEVLRGPQGTLYGANSEGGLLRYVTADPTMDRVSGRVEAGVNSIENGAEPGWSFRGSVNLPITNELGLLVDGFARQDAGYLDNPILGLDGVNESHTYGGHVALLWRPMDDFSAKISAFVQQSRGNSTDDVDVVPGLGPYDQNYIAGAGPYERQSELYDATLKYKIGAFELTSVTGYVWTGFHDSLDATSDGLVPFSEYGNYAANGIPGTAFNGFGVAGLVQGESAHSSSFSQELRLSTQIGKFVDVLIGGFYNYAYGIYGQNLFATNPTTGEVAGDWSFIGFGSASRSYAGFANLNFHITDQFGVQLGGRQERDYTYSYGTAFAGPGNPVFGYPTPALTVAPAPNGQSQKFTYLVTPQYKFSRDFMVYARLATGYAPGQANPQDAGIPPTSEPDTVTDYELGAKAEFFDHKWSVDTAIYHIKHNDIQAGVYSDTAKIYYYGNAGSARSDGVDLSTELRPFSGLHVMGWIAWNESRLMDVSAASGEGEGLPGASHWSGNLSLDQDLPLGASVTGFAGGGVTYLGDRYSGFGPTRSVFPEYTKTDLHVGARWDDWTARLYVNNLTNRRGILNGGPSTLIVDSYYFITPRTVGLLVSRKF